MKKLILLFLSIILFGCTCRDKQYKITCFTNDGKVLKTYISNRRPYVDEGNFYFHEVNSGRFIMLECSEVIAEPIDLKPLIETISN